MDSRILGGVDNGYIKLEPLNQLTGGLGPPLNTSQVFPPGIQHFMMDENNIKESWCVNQQRNHMYLRISS